MRIRLFIYYILYMSRRCPMLTIHPLPNPLIYNYNDKITANRKITAQNSRSAAVPYENVYADSFFGLSGAPGKGKGLLQQGPVGEYREMQLPLKRNFSSLQTPLVQNVSRYSGLHIYIFTYLCVCM